MDITYNRDIMCLSKSAHEKHLGVLVVNKLKKSQQYAATVKKMNTFPGCIKGSTVTPHVTDTSHKVCFT